MRDWERWHLRMAPRSYGKPGCSKCPLRGVTWAEIWSCTPQNAVWARAVPRSCRLKLTSAASTSSAGRTFATTPKCLFCHSRRRSSAVQLYDTDSHSWAFTFYSLDYCLKAVTRSVIHIACIKEALDTPLLVELKAPRRCLLSTWRFSYSARDTTTGQLPPVHSGISLQTDNILAVWHRDPMCLPQRADLISNIILSDWTGLSRGN